MEEHTMTFDQALDQVSAHSAGGAPFLIAYGLTFLVTGGLSYVLPDTTTALIAMFQGVVALPVGLWLERILGWGRMSPDNPLNRFSILLAVSQALAIPALIVIFNVNARAIPVVLAGLGGVHFLPYMWLHRTPIYAILAVAVALGAFGLQLWLGPTAFHINLLWIGALYLVAAPFVYRHAKQIVPPAAQSQ